MPLINLFSAERSDKEFAIILALNGQDVYRNGKKERAIITNSLYMKSYEEKFFNTPHQTQTGDLIYYDDRFWYITSQSQHRRGSWKAFIRPAHHDIIFNLNSLDDKPAKYLLKIPAIVSQSSDFNLSYSKSSATISVDSEIHVFIQHNAKTDAIFSLLDKRIVFGKRTWKVAGISTVDKGMLELTCELVPAQANDDLENSISDCPKNWESLIDDSTYKLNDTNQQVILPSKTATTVDFISFKDGVLTWTADKMKNESHSFVGYRITPYSFKMEWGADKPILKAGESFEVLDEKCSLDSLPCDIQTVFDNGSEKVVFEKKRIE